MTKVLQVFSTLDMGGAESRMMDVYRHLDREKVSFDFLTLCKGDQFYKNEILQSGSPVIEIDRPGKIDIFKHISVMTKIMKEGRYDAVHAHTLYHCGLVMLAAKRAKIPVRISHARNTDLPKDASKIYQMYLKIGKKLIKRHSTKLLAISRAAGDFLFDKEEYITVPNTIDMSKYKKLPQEEILKIKAELGVAENDFVVGNIGRFDDQKNHIFTVKWFAEYQKQYPNTTLVLIGDGNLRPAMEKLAEELGVQSKIVFTGVRKDANRLVSIFDVMFFPSKFEGLGGVVLEAQAASVPVVESSEIPAEADLDIGMVKVCSLDDSFDIWTDAVNYYKDYTVPDYEVIKQAFNAKGYNIESVTEKYCSFYRGE